MKIGRKLPIVLTDEEIKKLLLISNQKCITGLRNYTIMKMILNNGLRSEEVVSLKLQDINLNTGHTTVRNGKGFKDRCLYTKNDALIQLRTWVQAKEESEFEDFKNSVYIFPTLKGTKLDTRYLKSVFKRYGNKAGIKRDIVYIDKDGNKKEKTRTVSPHILRSTMASNYYRATKDIRGLQVLLGHENLNTTQLYVYVFNDEIASNLEHFQNKKRKEQETIERIKRLEDEIKELKNGIDKDKLFRY